MENKILDAILRRSSIRKFEATPLTDEQLDALKKAALASPTARNAQEQRFVFVTDRDVIERFDGMLVDIITAEGNKERTERINSRGRTVLYHPALLVVISGSPENFYSGIDAGIAADNIALTALSLGLGSVFLGMPRSAFLSDRCEEAMQLLHMEPDTKFQLALSVGVPAIQKTPHTWDEAHITEIR
ncbi:MAG: nitroreductase family protein [Oscillospiraceae bacterium]|nr:nitroreductase family protein [Oscillospiraceae bacterium]